MEKYVLELLYCDGGVEILITTDYIIEAYSKKEAMKIACEVESKIIRNINPYYDNSKDKVIVDISENKYFTKCNIKHFSYQKDNAIPKKIEGEGITLYPVYDGNDFYKCEELEFIQYLKKEYKQFFVRNEILTFECIAYGVEILENI
jgi:hypothetical protein